MNNCPDCGPTGRCLCPPSVTRPTVADALRGVLAVLPIYLLHDPAVADAVKQAREALK